MDQVADLEHNDQAVLKLAFAHDVQLVYIELGPLMEVLEPLETAMVPLMEAEQGTGKERQEQVTEVSSVAYV